MANIIYNGQPVVKVVYNGQRVNTINYNGNTIKLPSSPALSQWTFIPEPDPYYPKIHIKARWVLSEGSHTGTTIYLVSPDGRAEWPETLEAGASSFDETFSADIMFGDFFSGVTIKTEDGQVIFSGPWGNLKETKVVNLPPDY